PPRRSQHPRSLGMNGVVAQGQLAEVPQMGTPGDTLDAGIPQTSRAQAEDLELFETRIGEEERQLLAGNFSTKFQGGEMVKQRRLEQAGQRGGGILEPELADRNGPGDLIAEVELVLGVEADLLDESAVVGEITHEGTNLGIPGFSLLLQQQSRGGTQLRAMG